MKKLLLAIGVFVLVAILGIILLPYGFGYSIEKNYANTAKLFCPVTKCEARVMTYHRGWFNSRATIAINFSSVLTQFPVMVVLQQHIKHGPLLLKELPQASWMITPGLLEIQSYTDNPQINLKIATLIRWNHSIQIKIEAPLVITAASQQTINFAVKDAQANLEVSADQKQISGKFLFADLMIHTPTITQNMQQVTADFMMQKSVDGLWLGEQNLQINTGNFRGVDLAGQNILGLLGLNLKIISLETKGHIDWQFQAIANQLLVKNHTLGPYHLNLLITGLNAKTLAQINQLLPQNLGHVNDKAALPNNMWVLWTQLLNQGITMNVKQLDISTIWGNVAVNGNMVVASQPDVTKSTASLLDGLNGNLKIEFPATLLKDYLLHNYQQDLQQQNLATDPNINSAELVDKQINEWQQQGLLATIGERYQLNVQYAKKQLWVNGKPLVLPNQLQ